MKQKIKQLITRLQNWWNGDKPKQMKPWANTYIWVGKEPAKKGQLVYSNQLKPLPLWWRVLKKFLD